MAYFGILREIKTSKGQHQFSRSVHQGDQDRKDIEIYVSYSDVCIGMDMSN